MSAENPYLPGSIYRPVPRARLTDKQNEILTKVFDKNSYPNLSKKRTISKKTGLDLDQIRIWFQNKRARRNMKVKRLSRKPSSEDMKCDENVYEKCYIEEGGKQKEFGLESCYLYEVLKHCNEALSGEIR